MHSTTIKRRLQWVLTAGLWTFALAARAVSQDYQIGPGDTLKILVYQNPELGGELRVLQSGEIRVPLIEPVGVGGLTAEQAEQRIAQKLKEGKLVREPRVTVQVTGYRSQQVSVLGYVAKPGLYTLDRTTRLSELLAQAGGVTPAAADELVIQRGEGKQRVRLAIDQGAAFMNGDAGKDVVMQAGDMVYVPLAPVYYIKGEVAHPGAARVARSLTVEQALALAGDVGPRGSERRLLIKRRNAAGTLEVHPARLDELLVADDVLTVESCEFYIYGEVLRPGAYRADLQLTLQQALALGGGATARGSNRSLIVYRRTAAGETQALDSLKLADPVQPDDVIFVKDRLF